MNSENKIMQKIESYMIKLQFSYQLFCEFFNSMIVNIFFNKKTVVLIFILLLKLQNTLMGFSNVNIHTQINEEKYWVIFYADNSTLTGHSFVTYLKEDNLLQQTVIVACWGFYPKDGIGLFGYVEGSIRNDLARQKDIGLSVEVSKKDFYKALSIKDKWDAKKYNLLAENCIDFVDEVASQVCNLKKPSYTLRLPIDYIKSLKQLNKNYNKCTTTSTLFLFDLSGSMNENGGGTIPKIEQAKAASKITIDGLQSGSQGVKNQVAVYGFSGDCVPDPTIEISAFTDDLITVQSQINSMFAGGGTPLDNAIRAAECKMAAHLQKEGQKRGKLIILSDGQGTCGNIRPPGTYNSAPLQRNRFIFVDAGKCGLSNSANVGVSYYTVGFNIPPGSPAERDLQYLSQISGGKYLNVQNQTQLVRAFRKFNRVYQPKESPALSGLPTPSVSNFMKGVTQIKEEYFDEALSVYTAFAKQHSDDCHGAYNLALMQEANDFYKEAIKNYRKYLTLCPNPSDRDFVETQIAFLEEEFREFVLFQKEVVRSDLDFLNLHYQKIQNGQSVALAEEFKGFLREKNDYYEKLPRLIDNSTSQFKSQTEDIALAFKECSMLIRRNPQTWDRDGAAIIARAYVNLEELLGEM